MKKIAVIFGGKSTEYEISLESASSVISELEKLDFEVLKIGITFEGEWYLFNGDNYLINNDEWLSEGDCLKIQPSLNKKGFFAASEKKYITPDVLFPVLHGQFGEDGCIQGVFEMMEIPYVGCPILPSSLCMNKWILHLFSKSLGIESTPSIVVSQKESLEEKINTFTTEQGFPIFVKPNEGGSSKGITKANSMHELKLALDKGFVYCNKLIIQKSVDGIEIGCGILGNEELVIGECDEIDLQTDFFDYVEKYQLLSAKIHTPARISTQLSKKIKQSAELLYRSLGCRGLSRIDFFVTKSGEILLNEINTMPGFTSHSRFPAMLAAAGVSYPEVLTKLIFLAEESYGKYVSSVS